MASIPILLCFTNFSATNNASTTFQNSQNVQFSFLFLFFGLKLSPTIKVLPTDIAISSGYNQDVISVYSLHIILAWGHWAWA